jgi:hypothetical protein
VARLHALVIATVVGATTPAAAEVIALPKTKATITIGAEWKPIVAPSLVAAYRTDGGLLLAITRAQVPNIDAWRSKTRDAYVDEIERGVAASIAGYRRLSRSLGDTQGVPTLDLEARRRDGATIVIRVVLFRTYALALAIECPRRADVAAARTVAKSFAIPAPAP